MGEVLIHNKMTAVASTINLNGYKTVDLHINNEYSELKLTSLKLNGKLVTNINTFSQVFIQTLENTKQSRMKKRNTNKDYVKYTQISQIHVNEHGMLTGDYYNWRTNGMNFSDSVRDCNDDQLNSKPYCYVDDNGNVYNRKDAKFYIKYRNFYLSLINNNTFQRLKKYVSEGNKVVISSQYLYKREIPLFKNRDNSSPQRYINDSGITESINQQTIDNIFNDENVELHYVYVLAAMLLDIVPNKF